MMDLSIFGYKFNIEVLILIGIMYIIIVGHTFCGCCNYGMLEGFIDASIDASGAEIKQKIATAKTNLQTQVASGTPATPVEGFRGANTNYGESSVYDLTHDDVTNTSSWFAQDMTIVPGKALSDGVKQFMERKQQQLPLPDGEMDFFANVDFKPECCSTSSYSSSGGCACVSGQDYNYLHSRGGNNVPYSEY